MTEMVARWLNLQLEIENIRQGMIQMGVYASLIMKGKEWPRRLNRMVHKTYYRMFGETPFMSSLRIGSGTANFSHEKRIAYDLTVRPVIEGFEARHIHRRTILEKKPPPSEN